MEFPNLGKHCANTLCKRLDFLPMKCDACTLIFCNEHIHYNQHNCAESYRKDKHVPTCPLCHIPIPIRPGEAVDAKVDAHISADCQSDPAKERRKVYTNKCSLKGCKVKEMVQVNCERCKKNYCLKHRHENDHECKGSRSNSPMLSRTAAAAISRQSSSSASNSSHQPSVGQGAKSSPQRIPQATYLNSVGRELNAQRNQRASNQPIPVGSFQAGLTEQEALQRALQLSAAEQSGQSNQASAKSVQEAEDLALAQALEASEKEARRNAQAGRAEQSSCAVN